MGDGHARWNTTPSGLSVSFFLTLSLQLRYRLSLEDFNLAHFRCSSNWYGLVSLPIHLQLIHFSLPMCRHGQRESVYLSVVLLLTLSADPPLTGWWYTCVVGVVKMTYKSLEWKLQEVHSPSHSRKLSHTTPWCTERGFTRSLKIFILSMSW